MAVWEICIEKVLGSEYWINVYHANVATQAEARATGNAIVGVERGIHQTTVGFTKMRVRQVEELAGPGTVYPIGLNGTFAVVTSLPLFVVVRFDFAVGVGRPSRKYIKMPVPTAWPSGNVFLPAALTQANSLYSTPIVAVEGISASDGQEFISCSANPAVGMRQLRRGSRRRTEPVI